MGRAGGGERPAPGDRRLPSPPAGTNGPSSCWANRQRGWGVQGREKAVRAGSQSDLGALERRILRPMGFRARRAGGVPTWANRREPTVRSERLKCSGFSADCLQRRVVFCSYRAKPQQEEPRPPGGRGERGGREEEAGSRGVAAAQRGAPGPVTALLGVGGWGGWGVRDRSFSHSTAAPSPAPSFPHSLARPQPPHEGVRAGSGGRRRSRGGPRALDAGRGRRRRRRRRWCFRRRGAGFGAVGTERLARLALHRALRLCLPAAVAAASVPRAAAELPEPLPLPLPPVGSAQDHPLLRRLLAQRLTALAPAARSPALLPTLAALLLPLLSPVLHALSPQPLPGGGKAGGPACGAGRVGPPRLTPAEDRWGRGRGRAMRGGPKTRVGKLRHAWKARQCPRPKLKHLIDSVTEGLGG